MSYLLDTNTVSELMKPDSEPSVLFWSEQHENECFWSAVTVGEIEKGIALLPSGRKKNQLEAAFRIFLQASEERILSFDVKVAQRWAILTSASQRKGRTLSLLDSMIEATALYWDLSVVTRNVSDFVEAPTLNPWKLRTH